jgi:hypothetical protein
MVLAGKIAVVTGANRGIGLEVGFSHLLLIIDHSIILALIFSSSSYDKFTDQQPIIKLKLNLFFPSFSLLAN